MSNTVKMESNLNASDELQRCHWNNRQPILKIGEMRLARNQAIEKSHGSLRAIAHHDNSGRTVRKQQEEKGQFWENGNKFGATPAKQLTARGGDGSPYVVTVRGVEDSGETKRQTRFTKMTNTDYWSVLGLMVRQVLER